MRQRHQQSGFSAVELLITLIIAAAFLITGYQLYNFAVKDGGTSRKQAKASREADNYLQKNKYLATDPCSVQSPAPSTSNIDGLGSTTLTISVTCPYSVDSPISKITVTLQYGAGETAISSTFVKPTCPNGFIPVPGSATYHTADFCVMKYEAQNGGSSKPVSLSNGYPWFTSQLNAMDYSKNACSGCHLITEAEWLTIAENILGTPQSWTSGVIGSGSVPEGHSKSNPNSAVGVVNNDDAIYQGVSPNDPTQSRVLRLSNGQAIWDFTGNAWEWTSRQTAGGQPGDTSATWREWNAISNPGSLTFNPFPSYTRVAGASAWSCTQGMGKVFSSTTDTNLRGFIRGGGAADNVVTGCISGLFALILNRAPNYDNGAISFRVAR